MIAKDWLGQARGLLEKIEATQLDAVREAAGIMADSIAAERWVHTFGCGHATIPVEEMYPRIGGFVGHDGRRERRSLRDALAEQERAIARGDVHPIGRGFSR